MLCNRIFTITCRGGKALRFDNKPDIKGKRHYVKYTGTDSRTASLKAWIKILSLIPEDYDQQVAILLPSCVSFLSFSETRDFWITNECTKSGEMLDEETLMLVTQLDELLELKHNKVQNFGQNYVKAYKYRNEIALAWNTTNKVLPVEIVQAVEEEAF